MYKGASRGQQVRRDKGVTASRNGRPKVAKKGKPKSQVYTRLEATAVDVQLASWQRYLENCHSSGTTPFLPADVRRKLDLEE